MLILDATVGGANANAFLTTDQATSILEGRYHSGPWFSLTEDSKDALNVQATMILNREHWAGQKATSAQRLNWPRAYVPDPDTPADASLIYLDDSTIPLFLEEATAELAFSLISKDRLLETDTAGIKRIDVSSIGLEFDRMDRPGLLTAYIRRLIRPYLMLGGNRLLRA